MIGRKKYIKSFIVVATLASLSCLFLAIPLQGHAASKSITIAQRAGMPSWDPHGHSSTAPYGMWKHVIEPLVTYDYGKGQYCGILAESWEAQGADWIFKLRKGVKFHNGTDLTAHDVKFTIDKIKREGAKQASLLNDVTEVKVLDDHTVKITTAKPFAPFLLRIKDIVIVSEQVYKQYGKEAIKHPIGTGPYTFVEWIRGTHWVMKKNEAYWGEPAKIDQVVWKPIPEDAARVTALETGAVDIAADIPPHEVERLAKDPNIKLEQPSGLRIMQIALSPRFKPFQNQLVRQAMNHAVDIDSLITYVLDGMATRAVGLAAPHTMGYNPELKPYAYDPAKAKSLLAQAGYPNGFEVDFYAPSGRYPKDSEVAQAIAAQLAKVGIKANVSTPEFSVFWSNVMAGKYPMFYFGGFNHPDNDLFLSLYFQTGVTKRIGYSNPEVDKAIAEQRQEFNPERRETLLRKAMRTIVEDAPSIILWHHKLIYGVRKNVSWKPIPEECIFLFDASMR